MEGEGMTTTRVLLGMLAMAAASCASLEELVPGFQAVGGGSGGEARGRGDSGGAS
jgi:hypothetical protein